MSTKQDRRDKATKAANAQADEIIARLVAGLRDKGDEAPAREGRPEGLSDDEWSLACSVRDLRDQGEAWWKIGYILGLPGSADNVAQGKAGAGFARKVYKKGFGEVPRVQAPRVPGGKPRDVNPHRAEIKRVPKAERVALVRRGQSVISEDMPDEDVVKMVAGRRIAWSVNLGVLDGQGDHYRDEEANVHRVMVRVETQPNGVRVLHFKEVHDGVPIEFRGRAAGTRTIRLSAIHTIR